MQQPTQEIRDRLLAGLDKEYNVVNMEIVLDVISQLENFAITKEALEATRLGKHVNELRRKAQDRYLASRAKNLVKKWRQLLVTPASVSAAPSATPSAATTPNATPAHDGVGSRLGSPVASSHQSTTTNHRQQQPQQPTLNSRKLPGSSLPSSASTSPESRPASPYNDTAGVGRTHASNKRLRKEDVASASPPPGKRQKFLVNGIDSADDATRDSVIGVGSNANCDNGSGSQNIPPANTLTPPLPGRNNGHNHATPALINNRRKTRSQQQKKQTTDVLEQRMLSVGKKVRTTRQIVEELAARSHSPGLVARTTLSPAASVPASETQSELMSRFFRSQNGVTSPPLSGGGGGDSRVTSPALGPSTAPTSGTVTPSNHTAGLDDPASESINDVMAKLPIISLSEELARIQEELGSEDEDDDMDDDGLEVDGLIPVKRERKPELEVTTELVDRLHEDPIESFNGNFDHRGEFKEWNEVASKETTEGELLYVLPYCVID